MGYKILIKASGSSSAEVFKFYREPGTAIDYEVDTIDELTPTYEELLEKYPKGQVIPIHKLKVELNTDIEECGDPDPEQPEITEVTVSVDSEGIVRLTAAGKNLEDNETFNWTIVYDDNARVEVTSIGPIITLNSIQSSNYQSAETVRVYVSIGNGQTFFIVKTKEG